MNANIDDEAEARALVHVQDKMDRRWLSRFFDFVGLVIATLIVAAWTAESFLHVKVLQDGNFGTVEGSKTVTRIIEISNPSLSERFGSAMPTMVLTMLVVTICAFLWNRGRKERAGAMKRGASDFNIKYYLMAVSTTIIFYRFSVYAASWMLSYLLKMKISLVMIDMTTIIVLILGALSVVIGSTVSDGVKVRLAYKKAAAELDDVI